MRNSQRFFSMVFACALMIFPAGPSGPNPTATNWIYMPIVTSPTGSSPTQGMIIDHTTADLSKVPASYIEAAKSQFRLSYGHTSHGSQIVSGLGYWEWKNPLYSFNTDGSVESGVLSLADNNPSGDLGSGPWAQYTRDYLNTPGNNRNMVMWSWCGQLDGYSPDQVQAYLDDMNQLENDYPGVQFLYMTMHTNYQYDPPNNDIVRAYARDHQKLLFDFADMEKYTPDGAAVPLDQVSDSCPWCSSWCDDHPDYCADLSQVGSCAHTHPLLCKIKSQAFWWMMARLAGWDGVTL